MKKILSLFAALVCSVAMSAKDVYFVPNSNWLADDARFAVYCFGGGNEAWVDMTAVPDETNVYQATIEDSFPSIIFCRMNPATTENNWDDTNKWNQTDDLTVPTDGNNTYYYSEGGWDKGLGVWGVLGETPAEPDPTYGIGSNLNGYKPDSNPMTVADGVATCTINLTEGTTFEFSVVENGGTWLKNTSVTLTRSNNSTTLGTEENQENTKLTVDATGDYVFAFTIATRTLVVTFPGEGGGNEGGGNEGGENPQPVATYGIGSNLNSYKPDSNPMTVADGVATCTINLTEGTTFEFSVVENGSTWLKNTSVTLTRSNNSTTLGTEENQENTKLTVDATGDYVFAFTIATKTLVVTFPGESGGNEGGENPQPVATYGIGSNLNNWTAANDPMTIADGVATCTITLGTDSLKFSVVETLDGKETWLKNVDTPIKRDNNSVVLGVVNSYDNCVLVPDVAGDYVFAFTIATKTLVVTFPNQGEAITNTTTSTKATKIIRNGQVLILRDNVTYDLMGKEVK